MTIPRSGPKHEPSCRYLLALTAAVALVTIPRPATAQSADDVASRVGTVARAMGTTSDDPWTLDATLSADLSRGNTDSTNLRSTLVYVRDSGAWRFGSYLSGAVEKDNGLTNKERVGLNLALARRYREAFRVVLLEEIVRAPLDGLDYRNLLGGMLVWTPDGEGRVESSLYAGAGWASEHYTTDEPDSDYGALLAGSTASIEISETAELNLVGSYTQDMSTGGNFKIGSSVALRADVSEVMGLAISYALAYDHAPSGNRRRTNNTLSAGLTLGWKPE